jgi:membrane protein implicated in regulation of membrane protease activity
MFGAALRLLAVGEAGRRLGDYVKNLTTRYLVLGIAGIPFVAAVAFGILAAFWAPNLWIQNPIWSALIMFGILAGLLIVLTAYGITRAETPSARQALSQPVRNL